MRWSTLFLLTLFSFRQLNGAEVINDILVFSDKKEAVNLSFSTYWNYLPKEDHPKAYEKADAIVNELMPAFCRHYPDCEKFPKPEILLSYAPDSGSFGMYYEGMVRQSNVIIISSELYLTPEDMEFVIAHEMVHYFEKHAETVEFYDEITAINRQDYDRCHEYPWPFKDVKEDLISLIEIIDELGDKPHLVSEQTGLPIDGEMGEILRRMIRMSSDDPKCKDLTSDLDKLKERVLNGNFLYKSDPRVMNFLSLTSECFEKYDGNLLKDTIMHLRIKNADPSSWDEFDQIVNEDGDELERLIKIRTNRYNQYKTLSRKLSGPQLRYQTEEDIADVKALNILLESGRRNIVEYIDYLMVGLSPADQIRCSDDLKKGKEPNYGPLNREHHDECWRIWRAKKIEERYLRNYPSK
ncbi:MAG: hypothetical protein K9K67_14080 [Bacteriovoracaceae bacterium]|nr:hypothetical protein [Bacteriovoracaceae bacterium]